VYFLYALLKSAYIFIRTLIKRLERKGVIVGSRLPLMFYFALLWDIFFVPFIHMVDALMTYEL
jgi:hypothetical protein